jgi:dTDP-4-amino-4,6-dideoxygalactose transaminase
MNWRIALSDIDFGAEESKAVQDVLNSRWLSMGEVTKQFEADFAAYTGAKHAIAVTNATAALHLACVASDLHQGDEVILPSLTFVATANAIRYTGATPVFADIESRQSLNISPASIAKHLTNKTRAIMVMHYAGYPCDMPAIMQFAREHKLIVLEDAAHSAGAWLEDRHLGTWGDIGCFSFFSNKNMTTGEGGMLVTNDDALAERLRLLRSHGMTSLSWDRHKGHAQTYDVIALGYNYRIDEIRSALGREQLKKLDRNNAKRKDLTILYRNLLEKLIPSVTVPFSKINGGVPAYHIFPMMLPKSGEIEPITLPADNYRQLFMEGMKAHGVQTSIHYPPIHRFDLYAKQNIHEKVDLPITEEAYSQEVTLPLYATMAESDVRYVVEAAREVLEQIEIAA